jgi:hypothetical protein
MQLQKPPTQHNQGGSSTTARYTRKALLQQQHPATESATRYQYTYIPTIKLQQDKTL